MTDEEADKLRSDRGERDGMLGRSPSEGTPAYIRGYITGARAHLYEKSLLTPKEPRDA